MHEKTIVAALIMMLIMLLILTMANAQSIEQHSPNKYFHQAMNLHLDKTTTLENIIVRLQPETKKMVTYNEKINDIIRVRIILTSKYNSDLIIIVDYKEDKFNKLKVIAQFNGEQKVFINQEAYKTLQILASGDDDEL